MSSSAAAEPLSFSAVLIGKSWDVDKSAWRTQMPFDASSQLLRVLNDDKMSTETMGRQIFGQINQSTAFTLIDLRRSYLLDPVNRPNLVDHNSIYQRLYEQSFSANFFPPVVFITSDSASDEPSVFVPPPKTKELKQALEFFTPVAVVKESDVTLKLQSVISQVLKAHIVLRRLFTSLYTKSVYVQNVAALPMTTFPVYDKPTSSITYKFPGSRIAGIGSVRLFAVVADRLQDIEAKLQNPTIAGGGSASSSDRCVGVIYFAKNEEEMSKFQALYPCFFRVRACRADSQYDMITAFRSLYLLDQLCATRQEIDPSDPFFARQAVDASSLVLALANSSHLRLFNNIYQIKIDSKYNIKSDGSTRTTAQGTTQAPTVAPADARFFPPPTGQFIRLFRKEDTPQFSKKQNVRDISSDMVLGALGPYHSQIGSVLMHPTSCAVRIDEFVKADQLPQETVGVFRVPKKTVVALLKQPVSPATSYRPNVHSLISVLSLGRRPDAKLIFNTIRKLVGNAASSGLSVAGLEDTSGGVEDDDINSKQVDLRKELLQAAAMLLFAKPNTTNDPPDLAADLSKLRDAARRASTALLLQQANALFEATETQ